MSFDNAPDPQTDSTTQDVDLSAALAGTETGFVNDEAKKPPSMQFIILAGLVILAPVIIWIMYNRKGPASADAAIAKQPPAAAQTVRTFLNSGPSGIEVMRQMLKGTEKIVQECLNYASRTQVPLAELKTNPFRASTASGPDTNAAARRKREAAIRAVQNLRLESIMSGTHKACMINNTLYTEGQQVDQFTIEQISNGSVIVRTGPYRFELKMQR